MTDTSFILRKPKNKSSAGNTTSSILCDNDDICSQCGHDHSHKATGDGAIQDMISFLDRNSSKEEI